MRATTILATATAALLVSAAPAAADHAYGSDIAIRALADDVEYFAGQVYREGDYLARQHRRDHHALRYLRDLDHEARHFNRQVRRYYSDPLHVAHDFERLRSAFYRAHDGATFFYGYTGFESDFHALADAMRRLEYAFRDFGYRYQRPFPRLRFSINLGIPYHHPRGHRVYRKPYEHGYRWYSSVDLHYYKQPRHHKRYYKNKHDRHHDRRRHYDRHDRHSRKHYNSKHHGGKHHKSKRGKHYRGRDDDHDDRHHDRRRGSARRARPRR